jgi:hypothetical protein
MVGFNMINIKDTVYLILLVCCAIFAQPPGTGLLKVMIVSCMIGMAGALLWKWAYGRKLSILKSKEDE